MKPKFIFILSLLLSTYSFSQTAPSHLKYWGYAIVDCLFDDPHDGTNTTNYIAEVDSFSNLAQMCIYSPTDDITARVSLMNNHCVNPVVHIQSLFYEIVGTNAPSGEDHSLTSTYSSRWNSFKTTNSSVLNKTNIGAFYISDEPFWNGLTFQDLKTVSDLIKLDYPDIPIMIVEASGALSVLQIPTTIDWIGFDNYGVFDPGTDAGFLADLALLKSKKSNINQKLFLTVDDQWLPLYGNAGFPPDTIRFMVQNYYNLAASDTSIIGLMAYLWPGGLDEPNQLGVRNMPQSVIDMNVKIGTMIKANYSPCTSTAISEFEKMLNEVNLYPNPTNGIINLEFNQTISNGELNIFNFSGTGVYKGNIINSSTLQLDFSKLNTGIYFYAISGVDGLLKTGKFVKW